MKIQLFSKKFKREEDNKAFIFYYIKYGKDFENSMNAKISAQFKDKLNKIKNGHFPYEINGFKGRVYNVKDDYGNDLISKKTGHIVKNISLYDFDSATPIDTSMSDEDIEQELND